MSTQYQKQKLKWKEVGKQETLKQVKMMIDEDKLLDDFFNKKSLDAFFESDYDDTELLDAFLLYLLQKLEKLK